MPTFEPPVAYDTPTYLPDTPRGPALFLARWMNPRARGRTVLKVGSTYRTVDTPTVDEVNAADIAYLGGHIYTVTSTEAAALTAAGYVVT
jgi:hypothetical protein